MQSCSSQHQVLEKHIPTFNLLLYYITDDVLFVCTAHKVKVLWFYVRLDVDTDLADGLKLFVFLVVAGQQEASVHPGPFAFSQVGPDHTEINGVAHSVQVILFQLQL